MFDVLVVAVLVFAVCVGVLVFVCVKLFVVAGLCDCVGVLCSSRRLCRCFVLVCVCRCFLSRGRCPCVCRCLCSS